MHSGQMIFVQLMEFLPRHNFNRCVRRDGGDRRPRGFSCRDEFLCLAFAHLSCRESLRDIETCLRSLGPKLYHAGLRGSIARSTLADSSRVHDWRILADFAPLRRFTQCSAYFVTRANRNLDFTRRASRKVDRATGLRSDQTIRLARHRKTQSRHSRLLQPEEKMWVRTRRVGVPPVFWPMVRRCS